MYQAYFKSSSMNRKFELKTAKRADPTVEFEFSARSGVACDLILLGTFTIRLIRILSQRHSVE